MSASTKSLQERLERIAGVDGRSADRQEALEFFAEFREHLNKGSVRAAEKVGGRWRVNPWVKEGILLGFKAGMLGEVASGGLFRFYDKETLPLRSLSLSDGVRVVPGGSAIRDGAYVAPGVICMPPMYVNIGAFVDEGSMIDSHALVGSCAQVGKGVHISAGAQIGGVLEPVGALPVIIEDHALIGGNCGIYEGTIVGKGAVIAAGVVLTGGSQVHDLVHERIYRKDGDRPLEIPENAVVVPGSRKVRGTWGESLGLSVSTPLVVKYRDEKTDLSTLTEEILR